MSRRPLSQVDTAWLRMDEPTNLMMITGVMVFGERVDFDRLGTTLQRGLLRHDRFHQRVVIPDHRCASPYWEEDSCFSLDYHLKRIALAPPADRIALQDVASELASAQLDRSRPLWQLHLVEEYGEGSALICRLHHCIGDGLALVHVLLSLASTEPDAPSPEALPTDLQPEPSRMRMQLGRAWSIVKTTVHVKRSVLREGVATLRHPSRVRGIVRQGTRAAAAAGRLILRWPDPETVLKGALGTSKRAVWSDPIDLSDAKVVGGALGGTVNDVLLTATTGAFRKYLESHVGPGDMLDFRAIVPVNLRPAGLETELGNRFGMVFLSLPVGIPGAVERLAEVKRRMDGLKGSLEAPVAYGILNLMGTVPPHLQDAMVGMFGAKATAVMTNVVGPKERLYLAGAPLKSLMFWVPQAGRLGIGVSILSYAGEVRIGLIVDEGLVPDPESILDSFHAEFNLMLDIARKRLTTPKGERMASMLDGALETLDTLLAEAATPPTHGNGDQPILCQSITRDGRPCRNRPLSGSRYCRWHQPAGDALPDT
jgi:diacylglycerol O-acyltransferase